MENCRPDLIKFLSHLNYELNGPLNTRHEVNWEQDFVEKQAKFHTRAKQVVEQNIKDVATVGETRTCLIVK